MADQKRPTNEEQAAAMNAAADAAIVINRAVSQGRPVLFATTGAADEPLKKAGYEAANPESPLMYVLSQASGSATKKAPRLAFTEHPAPSENYLGLFRSKRRLLPDDVIKQIRIQDHLVAAILRARGNMLSLYGHLRKDRFDTGLEVAIKAEIEKILTPEQLEKVQFKMKQLEKILLSCGHSDGLENQDKMTISEFFDLQARNGLSFGRFGTEIIYDRSGDVPKFNRFRPVDIGTIYKTVRKGEYIGNNLREVAIKMLEALSGEKPSIDSRKLKEDQYAWLQVIEGLPRQAFTHEELLVTNLFPSTDIEHNGYPLSPIDTCVSCITTHISIDTYEKLYFQNGRASKGLLLIQSDEVDEAVINNVKLQFNAAINSVSNSFRTPIFGVGKDDKVDWLSMTGEGMHDGDFQYMYDQVCRNILSAFNISPDELPGYNHLSKGTNSQTLSESNNEFKLTASRDTGLRPLILHFQTFLNEKLLPLIDPLLAKICEIRLAGLDAQNKEQESQRLQQDMPTHMTYDEVLKQVDKETIGTYMGGAVPFNERWQLLADKYMNVAEIRAETMDSPASMVDPLLKYKRDPFFLQWMQLLAQTNPLAVKAYFSPKPFSMEMLKMFVSDSLDEEDSYGS
jgi:hypothetical protein